MSQARVGSELGCSQGKINKIETQDIEVKLDELDTLIKVLAIDDSTASWMRDVAHRYQQSRKGRAAGSRTAAFSELTDVESSAEEILCWHSERIPGPLQSENYMLQQRCVSEENGDCGVSSLYKERQARKKVFTVADPPQYHVILSESSLARMPGGRTPQLVVDQAEYLLSLIDTYENFTLQILTFDAPIAFADSDFMLLRFNSAERRDFAYVEHPGGARKYDVKQAYLTYWDLLCRAALTRDDSRQFIVNLINEWRAKWHPM